MAPRITKHLINRNCTFINQMYPPLVFVVHRTAGHVTNQQLYDYWQQTCISSHFGINWNGDQHDIWQFVELWDGSGANCCPESGCHPFFADRGGNANVYTISVEVCTPDTGNRNLMQPGQVEALVYLIQTVCTALGIPTDQYSEYWNDYETRHTWIGSSGGVGQHSDVSPHNKQWCVGQPYYDGQMDEVMAAVNGGAITGGNYMSQWGDKSDEMAARIWNSYFDSQNVMRASMVPPQAAVSRPRMGTGIYNKWKEFLQKDDNFFGPVLTEEFDFSGKKVQTFTGGQITYDPVTHEYNWIYTG